MTTGSLLFVINEFNDKNDLLYVIIVTTSVDFIISLFQLTINILKIKEYFHQNENSDKKNIGFIGFLIALLLIGHLINLIPIIIYFHTFFDNTFLLIYICMYFSVPGIFVVTFCCSCWIGIFKGVSDNCCDCKYTTGSNPETEIVETSTWQTDAQGSWYVYKTQTIIPVNHNDLNV